MNKPTLCIQAHLLVAQANHKEKLTKEFGYSNERRTRHCSKIE